MDIKSIEMDSSRLLSNRVGALVQPLVYRNEFLIELVNITKSYKQVDLCNIKL